jgi:hypothetical protein
MREQADVGSEDEEEEKGTCIMSLVRSFVLHCPERVSDA